MSPTKRRERQKPAPKPAAAEEVGRLRKKEVEDAELERLKKALDKSVLVEESRTLLARSVGAF